MALVVGVPFVWAIYLSFTDAIGGSLTGHWVGFDNFTTAWHDDNFRRALRNTLVFTLASQAIVVVGAAVLLELPRPRLPRQVDRALPRRPSLGRAGRPLDDHMALAPRLAVQRRQLDARTSAPRQRSRLGARRGPHRGGRPGSAAVARPAEPRAARDHDRARLADPPVRGRDLHRGQSVDPDRGRGRHRRSTVRRA